MRALKTCAAPVSCKPRSRQGTRGRRVPAASGRAEPRRSRGGWESCLRKDETSRRSRGASRSPEGCRGGGRPGRSRSRPPPPSGFYPRRPHTALPLHGEGSAAGGQRIPAAAGEGGPGRGCVLGGGTDDNGGPCVSAGRPLPLPVRSALPPASLPRLP